MQQEHIPVLKPVRFGTVEMPTLFAFSSRSRESAHLRLPCPAQCVFRTIIDLGAREVAVYRTPVGGTYRQHDVLRSDDRLQIPGVAAAKMRVGDLFD